jgi:hypothetical protein
MGAVSGPREGRGPWSPSSSSSPNSGPGVNAESRLLRLLPDRAECASCIPTTIAILQEHNIFGVAFVDVHVVVFVARFVRVC